MLISIILCSYNETGRIQHAVHQLQRELASVKFQYELIFVDNASTDGTREWIESLPDINTIKILNRTNIGKGGSIRLGLEASSGEYVIIHDPDLEYDAKDIPPLLKNALDNNAQLALGSRVLGGEDISYKYFQNYIGVAVLTKIINILFRSQITDPATALKIMESHFIKSVVLTDTGFNLDFEIVVKTLKLGGLISETRISYYPRTKAEGKKLKAWKDGLASLITILKCRLQSSKKFRQS